MADHITTKRMRLYERVALAFRLELKDEGCTQIYDDEFLLRMSRESKRISRYADKSFIFMCILDIFVLLSISGTDIDIQMLGIKVKFFPGIVEILISLSSISFHICVSNYLNLKNYVSLIVSFIEHTHPRCNPYFDMASLDDFTFFEEIISMKITFESHYSHKIFQYILWSMQRLVGFSIVSFHVFAVYMSITYIKELLTFGPLYTNIILVAIVLLHSVGILYLFAAYLYPVKFQVWDRRES